MSIWQGRQDDQCTVWPVPVNCLEELHGLSVENCLEKLATERGWVTPLVVKRMWSWTDDSQWVW